jgi:hypothetical protein
VLWLVPLVILAAPRLREYAVWQVIEVVHWIAVFTKAATISRDSSARVGSRLAFSPSTRTPVQHRANTP